jgi:hypothetical protein
MSLVATVIFTNILLSLENKKTQKKEMKEKEYKKGILKNTSSVKFNNKTKYVSYK